MAKDKTAIQQSAPAGIEAVPEYLMLKENEAPVGLENASPSDIKMPVLRLCQSKTPQREENSPAYIEGLREGDFFNTVTKQIYGKSVHVIGLHYAPSQTRWEDKKILNSPILCRSSDGLIGIGDPGGECRKCEFNRWGERDQKTGKSTPPGCTAFKNFMALVADESGHTSAANLVVVPFKSIGIDTAQMWITLARMRQPPTHLYMQLYKLSSVHDTRASGTSEQPKIDNAGYIPQDSLPIAKSGYEFVMGILRSGQRIEYDEPVAAREPGDEMPD